MSTDPRVLLITGASGYLGRHLVTRAASEWRVVGTYLSSPVPPGAELHRLELRDCAAVAALLEAVRPAVVLHTAYRYDDPSVTTLGTRHLVDAAEQRGARFVFVSTDMVFDGQHGWYRENDPPNPLGFYGAAKVEAERLVLAHGGVVARTSLIYGFEPLDPITRKLVVEPLKSGTPSTLFYDEYRSPSYAPDLAAVMLELAASDYTGIVHLAGPQRLSRYELGCKLALALGLDPVGLQAVSHSDSGLVRPGDCSLDTSLARRLLRQRIRSVDEAVGQVRQVQ